MMRLCETTSRNDGRTWSLVRRRVKMHECTVSVWVCVLILAVSAAPGRCWRPAGNRIKLGSHEGQRLQLKRRWSEMRETKVEEKTVFTLVLVPHFTFSLCELIRSLDKLVSWPREYWIYLGLDQTIVWNGSWWRKAITPCCNIMP